MGFTTDYTVATWVGNFDGDSMRQVSGVMGAAPLWQRIMLHLHENHSPSPFPQPQGMVKRPICALSGLKPIVDCEEIVQEYLFIDDCQISNQTFSRDYDTWLAKQPQSASLLNHLQILSPQEGDVFLMNPDGGEKLKLQLGGVTEEPIEWLLNGKTLKKETNDSYFWQMQPGEWTLEVKSGTQSDRISFTVLVSGNQKTRRGFSVSR